MSERVKRKKGRPVGVEGGVGRGVILAAAAALLQKFAPAHFTIAAVAREAEVDPALVRYYFGSRDALLLEVLQHITATEEAGSIVGDPAQIIAQRVHSMFRFTRAAKHMQRLMIEELDGTQSPELREKVKEWNAAPIRVFDEVKDQDTAGALMPFDSLFLHLALIGLSDFFVSGAPLVEMLVPPGTDMAELDRRYEAFVVRLLLDGLRRRPDEQADLPASRGQIAEAGRPS